MATRVWNKSFLILDDPALRAWGAGFKTELEALGLVSYGGINWATVVKGATISGTIKGGIIGSEVYGFADTLQAANPVFIQFTYYSTGFNSGNNDRLTVVVEVGFAQDGAGHLTGKKSIARAMEVAPYSNTSNYSGLTNATVADSTENRLSGNSSRLTIFWGCNPPFVVEYAPVGYVAEAMEDSNGFSWTNGNETGNFLSGCLTIERSRDNAGAETTDGVVFAHSGFYKLQNTNIYTANGGTNLSARCLQFVPYADIPAPPVYAFNKVYPYNRLSALLGSKISVFPFIPISYGVEQNPPIGLLGCQDFDFDVGGSPGVEVYGVGRTYYKTNSYARSLTGRFYQSSRFLMLWE